MTTQIENTKTLSEDTALPPMLLPIPAAQRFSGISRSEIYRRLATGDIRAVKSGARTLITTDSLRAYLASLPPATFRGRRTSR